MAAWTKTQLTTEAQEAADARNSQRWNPTSIARIADLVYRNEWKAILEANQFYRVAVREPTVTATGFIDIDDLSTSTEKLFRVIALGDTQPWEMIGTSFPWFDAGTVSYFRAWYQTGDGIQLLPNQMQAGVRVIVNHRPPNITDLMPNDAVVFPDGYEYILALEIAAVMLNKGGAESSEGAVLKALAETYRGSMLGEIQRTSTQPLRMIFGEPREHYDS